MEKLQSVYFELSNEDRLSMLQKLLEGRMNVTTLSREIDLSTQECSRHLSRLSEAELVSRDHKERYGRARPWIVSAHIRTLLQERGKADPREGGRAPREEEGIPQREEKHRAGASDMKGPVAVLTKELH
ncbi:MAG: winged helix-turn-helix transcriptional regulator [Candidatus Bathyarchaeota archaeon]|nr:MAG: winged helix-turn-helix transcriptional regulator [Candidatus Bathyarchaeota archaeon]